MHLSAYSKALKNEDLVFFHFLIQIGGTKIEYI